tara:strand:- start:278 stop:418 length:141 start_codon:yes stop_codon:yes gene_type:complete
MIKIIGFFWLFVFIAAIAGFVWLGLTDIPVQQQNVVIEIPNEELLK